MSGNRSFISHLEELRLRILYSLLSVFILAAVSYVFNEKILKLICGPLGKPLVFIAPQEAFIVSLKVSFLSGVLFSAPVILFNFWKFVGQALKKSEKKLVLTYLPATLLLFACGVIFAYMLVLPYGLRFLTGIGGGYLIPMISVEKYVNFFILLTVVFGAAFQIPVIMRFISAAGIISREEFAAKRRYAIVAVFILAALLTPPDVFTQIALALPILLLYEIGIMVSRRVKKAPPGKA
ncbi:MAG: twin-arginine translocase subunit TatC [Elusimicrobia bacterium]|nr:twin-arginine translocase subunit TatC [Elusimicrobiota bacterium]